MSGIRQNINMIKAILFGIGIFVASSLLAVGVAWGIGAIEEDGVGHIVEPPKMVGDRYYIICTDHYWHQLWLRKLQAHDSTLVKPAWFYPLSWDELPEEIQEQYKYLKP